MDRDRGRAAPASAASAGTCHRSDDRRHLVKHAGGIRSENQLAPSEEWGWSGPTSSASSREDALRNPHSYCEALFTQHSSGNTDYTGQRSICTRAWETSSSLDWQWPRTTVQLSQHERRCCTTPTSHRLFWAHPSTLQRRLKLQHLRWSSPPD